MDPILLNFLDDTSSSSSEDEEGHLIILSKLLKEKRVKVTNFYSVTIPAYLDDAFESHFRLNRIGVENFLRTLNASPNALGRSGLSIEKSFLLTLWTLANKASFRTVGNLFGVATGNAHEIFIRTCKMIAEKSGRWIVWPKGEEAQRTVRKFDNLRGPKSFPHVIGCVDGSHIEIPMPSTDPAYVNRKSFASITVQGTCDAAMKFTNVYCGWAGGTHDARVWRNSTIAQKLLNNREEYIPEGCYLLGDCAYPLTTFLMKRFVNDGHLSALQSRFNKKLSSTRVIIENAFGRLKGMWLRLKFLEIYHLPYFKEIMMTCCALHNACIDERIVYVEPRQRGPLTEEEQDTQEAYEEVFCAPPDEAALAVQNFLLHNISY